MRPLLSLALLVLAVSATGAQPGGSKAPPAAEPGGPDIVGGVPFNPHCRTLTRPAPAGAAAREKFEALFREMTQRGPQASNPGSSTIVEGRLQTAAGSEYVTGELNETAAADEDEGPIQRLVIRRAWEDAFVAGSVRESNNGLAQRADIWLFEYSITTHQLLQVRRTLLSTVQGQPARLLCMRPGDPYAQRRWLDVVGKLRDASIPRIEI